MFNWLLVKCHFSVMCPHIIKRPLKSLLLSAPVLRQPMLLPPQYFLS